MHRLEGKVAIVSGAARGIGAAIAQAMADEGAKVVIGDVLDEEGKALAAEIGPAARYVRLDVTKPAEWAGAVEAATRTFGKLNVLVNNAGISTYGLIEHFSHSDWEKTIAINLTGGFNGIKAAIPALRSAGGGSIVNIASAAAMLGYTGLPGYIASKWGIRGLTKAAALELARDRIRVNSVHPGIIRTPLSMSGPAPAVDVNPLRRAGEPSEVGHLVMYLASDESSFSTGSEFILDGGQTAGAVMWGFEDEHAAA
ncbi:glucose 1-dehydrogenase [Piscinibacter sp. XHJ-5]|uniref:glucose 1-dehydrogenase n=1 Tax=Piscinibacter sp. XHJ-5 TaxID=3037797 RepID=UPI0024533C7C|nr:glucose 1-dehydrogenase [Piscinibacter sp. XHJ-5]